MRCPDCNGVGDFEPIDEDGRIECAGCDGRGWVFLSDWIWYRWFWLTAPIRVRWEQLAYTRIGDWWWRIAWRHYRAWRLSKYIETEFQGHAKCGHRINLLHGLIRASEHTDIDVGMVIDKQRRMVWEANRALQIKQAKGG